MCKNIYFRKANCGDIFDLLLAPSHLLKQAAIIEHIHSLKKFKGFLMSILREGYTVKFFFQSIS